MRISREAREEGWSENEWKNRRLISVKLTPTNYSKMYSYMQARNLNWNSGVNHLLLTHPDLENYV